MSIKAGAILFDANGYVLDRIQSGGPGSLNIPEEKIYEVGNWQSVGTVYDIPDLSFDLESFDVTPEFEYVLLRRNPLSPSSPIIDFQDAYALDVISPFKSARNQYDIIAGVAVPYLTLERVSYRFGVGQSASQTFTLRGDSVYYCPGQPIIEVNTISGNGSASKTCTYTHGPAAEYVKDGSSQYVLNATLYNETTNAQKRIYVGEEITSNNTTQFVLAAAYNDASLWTHIQFVYSSETGEFNYPQSWHAGAGTATVAPSPGGVKPAAVRAKDIDVYTAAVGDAPENTGNWTRLTGVQSAEATWSVSLENDEELGNSRYVAQEYDVPEVNGSLTIKAFDVADLFDKIRLVTGITNSEQVLGPDITDPIQLKVGINDPVTGSRIKTIYVPEARFTVPGMNAQVQTKLESQFDFTADTGEMLVYGGDISV
jgi:hypothetical protein